jgi:hypothetical protein
MYCGQQVCVTYMNLYALHRPFCNDNLDKVFVFLFFFFCFFFFFFFFPVMRYNKLKHRDSAFTSFHNCA